MTTRKLKAVDASTRPQQAKPQTVSSAAASGDRRALLVAMRARISAGIDNMSTPARDLAALSRRLLEIAKEIEAIDADSQGDDIGQAASTPDEDWSAG